MKRVKIRWIALIALFAAFLITIGAAFGLTAPRRASAADYEPNRIFTEGTGGTVSVTEHAESETGYMQFSLENGGNIYFRRDLAIKWRAQEPQADSDEGEGESGEGEDQTRDASSGTIHDYFFSLVLNFPSVDFETFTITFESEEENISKDGKAKNSLVFLNEESTVTVAVQNAYHQDDDDEPVKSAVTVAAGQDIAIAFSAESYGDFTVSVNGTDLSTDNDDLKFTNIGGYYLEYLSSSATNPKTPLTFTAKTKAEGEGETQTHATQKVVVKSMNGQSFAVNEDGKIVDDAQPVVVTNGTCYGFKLGTRFDFSYKAIDVCDDYVSVTRNYYIYDEESADEEGKITVEYKSLSSYTYFLRQNDQSHKELVLIYFSLDDERNDDKGSRIYTRVYLSWFTDPSRLGQKTVKEDKEQEEKEMDFIVVDDTASEGPSYRSIVNDPSAKTSTLTTDPDLTKAIDDYQQLVDAAAEDVTAGKGSYFYLPSLRELIECSNADYRNMKFTVYYYKPEQDEAASLGSTSALNYNALRFEVDKRGQYEFYVVASDGKGNAMKMYVDGEWVEINANNVQDTPIPSFRFFAEYTGASINDPGEQSLGYRDSVYSVGSFTVVGIEGYQQDYSLYYLDESKLQEGTSLVYSEMVKEPEKYEAYLREIQPFNDKIEEDDERWDRTDNDYAWNPDSSRSFRPKESGFYFVKLTVSDAAIPGSAVSKYMVIEVRNPTDTVQGETQWLQNNVMAIVLFCIAGVLFIALIVVFTVKPSNKKVEDVELDQLKGAKGKKKQDK